MTTRKGDIWYCEECGVPQGRHDQWFQGQFEGLCGDCHAVERNTNMKDEVERILISLWAKMGMNIPNNYEDIVQYCFEDVLETADKINWSDSDVAIAFRRWIEDQGNK